MPLYRYQARSSSGKVQSGTLPADSVMAASALIRNQGLRVVQINPVGASRGKAGLSGLLKALNYSSGPSQRDVLDFTTQLAVMTRAGISIRAALEGIADQVTNLKWRKILLDIRQDVESGRQFSEAIARHPKLFSPLYVNMVRASEMSGSFAKMLDRIAAYLQQQLETRKMVIGAMIYPGIIGSMAIGVTVFLLTFVLPRFSVVFEGKEDLLPAPTVFLMALSATMVNYWYIFLGAVLALLTGLILFLRTRLGRLTFDRVKLTAPVFKRMFRALYINRSLHTMGELLGAGVPMREALRITGDVAGNIYYKQLWRAVHSSVEQGKKIITPLQKSTLLPKAVVQMIAAGEEAGKLAEVLDEVAQFYSRLLRDAIRTVTSMIEPIMIILMGSVVGFIAMAIILPIFKMSSLVK
ncbi:MAG: type II secretion system F family protein [Planctomycetes bacterium]|nr:type II secretion system F family protein [Planctomycetota bacterium]NOG53018.1 type II secretion system F family protein [Planctomycetota bacterium]